MSDFIKDGLVEKNSNIFDFFGHLLFLQHLNAFRDDGIPSTLLSPFSEYLKALKRLNSLSVRQGLRIATDAERAEQVEIIECLYADRITVDSTFIIEAKSIAPSTDLIMSYLDEVSENQKLLAEQDRVKSENQKLLAEQDRVKSENQKLLAEQDRVKSENQKLLAEQDRVKSENQKLLAEQDRVKSENQKLLAEQDRVKSENQKLLAEQDRVKSENQKLLAEQDRVKSENQKFAAIEITTKNNLASLDIRGEKQVIVSGTDLVLPPPNRDEKFTIIKSRYKKGAPLSEILHGEWGDYISAGILLTGHLKECGSTLYRAYTREAEKKGVSVTALLVEEGLVTQKIIKNPSSKFAKKAEIIRTFNNKRAAIKRYDNSKLHNS